MHLVLNLVGNLDALLVACLVLHLVGNLDALLVVHLVLSLAENLDGWLAAHLVLNSDAKPVGCLDENLVSSKVVNWDDEMAAHSADVKAVQKVARKVVHLAHFPHSSRKWKH